VNTYVALFVIALMTSLVLTPLVRIACVRFGWLDTPDDARRIHARAVPRLGGVPIYVAVLVALASLLPFHNLVTESLRDHRMKMAALLIPASMAFLLGVWDDLKPIKPAFKFLGLGLAATVCYALGGRIEILALPFFGAVQLPVGVDFVVTVVWMIGIANAFNLIDGVDGLAAGAALFACIVILVVSLMLDNPLVTVIGIAFAGAIIGFLRYNFNPASIFLGDSGALFIGFTFAELSVIGAQKASTAVAVAIPLLAFGLPIIDTSIAILRRFVSGRPVFSGDREHIHHMLLERGWSQRRVVLILYAVCAALGLFALLFVHESTRGMTGLVLLVVGAAVVLAVGRLQYHEVEEIKASFRRHLPERRKRGSNNIALRRATRSLAQAENFSQLFIAVGEMLEIGEFAYCSVQFVLAKDVFPVLAAALDGKKSGVLKGAEVRDGSLHWCWSRDGISHVQVVDSGSYWTLRMPLLSSRGELGYINFYREFENAPLLLDVNYLLDLFRRELAESAQRILEDASVAAVPQGLAATAVHA